MERRGQNNSRGNTPNYSSSPAHGKEGKNNFHGTFLKITLGVLSMEKRGQNNSRGNTQNYSSSPAHGKEGKNNSHGTFLKIILGVLSMEKRGRNNIREKCTELFLKSWAW